MFIDVLQISFFFSISQISQESTCVGVFFNKVAGPQNCNFAKKRRFLEICEIFKNNLFYWTSPVPAADSFRFSTWNFIKKEIPSKMFFCEFCVFFKNFLWQKISRWVLLKLICELWEVFQNTSFMENLWEIAYFKYKIQNFNQQIQWKTISHVLFKHLIQEREVAI